MPDRHWNDILVYDNLFEWQPVNIKIITTNTYDNVGSMVLCMQVYTDKILDYEKIIQKW